ncbi:hypothetical protein CM15mP37_11690 [bacterium]|nr:MAG: hypothetical protein CM15mP37_11690 [bacterium]
MQATRIFDLKPAPDTVGPIMTITATNGSSAVADGATTNDNTLTVTFTSNEATTNFAASDITVTGGAISNFAATSSPVLHRHLYALSSRSHHH